MYIKNVQFIRIIRKLIRLKISYSKGIERKRKNRTRHNQFLQVRNSHAIWSLSRYVYISDSKDFHNLLRTVRWENIYFTQSEIANFRSQYYLLNVSPTFRDVGIFFRYSGSSPYEILNQDLSTCHGSHPWRKETFQKIEEFLEYSCVWNKITSNLTHDQSRSQQLVTVHSTVW